MVFSRLNLSNLHFEGYTSCYGRVSGVVSARFAVA